ncbi:F-box domain containing protein [Tanacetum coccineum]
MLRATHSISSKSISSEVFSLKTGSWRTVQVSHIDINRPDKIESFSNGAVHWLVRTVCDSDKLYTILSFDMKEETFKETALPNITRSEYTGFVDLGDLKGCLYAVYGGDDSVDLDFWVMKEYGVENSWSMIIRLNCVEFGSDYSLWPVCFTHEDDVVISLDGWDIVRYNLSDKTLKKFKRRLTDWTRRLVYTETLVSPYG